MTTAKADIVSVIEAAYRAAESDDAWLGDLLAAIAPAMDLGGGVVGVFYEASPDRGVFFSGARASRPEAAAFAKISEQREVHGGNDFMLRLWAGPSGLNSTSRRSGLGAKWIERPGVRPAAEAVGVADVLALKGYDPSGIGVGFVAPSRELLSPTRAEVALWARVGSHLAAGLRLRRGAGSIDAVLAPSGKLEHAEASAQGAAAREALTQGVRSIERARGGLRRRDAAEAVEIWRALVRGEWSLVDHFDHDGRRYIVAKKNKLVPHPWHALTERERQVAAYAALGRSNKLIAYELGLSLATVARSLASAATKIGVASRLELIQAHAALDSRGAGRRRASREDGGR
jgi:DNA-binding CsgD family transcriptional regulator